MTSKNGEEKIITSKYIIIATGGRPNLDVCEGGENCISSDDLFSMKQEPGKTLLIGASYIALECGGFLSGMGYPVDIMVRSILLRGFDQEIAEKIGDFMTKCGVKFIRPAVPTKIEKLENGQKRVY